jgi:hypothetical protein
MGTGLRYLNNIAPADESIFTKPWLQQVYNSNQSTIKKLLFIQSFINNGESISLFKPSYTLEYGLFGENVTRRLIPLRILEEYEEGSFLITSSEIKEPGMFGLVLVEKTKQIYIYR